MYDHLSVPPSIRNCQYFLLNFDHKILKILKTGGFSTYIIYRALCKILENACKIVILSLTGEELQIYEGKLFHRLKVGQMASQIRVVWGVGQFI